MDFLSDSLTSSFGFRPTNIQIPQVENNSKVEEEVNENQIDDERGLGDEFIRPSMM